jgi:TubC N-terminal docking domain
MTFPELQSCLDRLGVNLSIRLVVDAPAGAMTPEVKNALATHKPTLLALLAIGSPPVHPDWERLSRERWGPAVGDPTPGIIVDGPARGRIVIVGDPEEGAAVLGGTGP